MVNIDNGKIKAEYVYWLLLKLAIFLVKYDEWRNMKENCWKYDDIEY